MSTPKKSPRKIIVARCQPVTITGKQIKQGVHVVFAEGGGAVSAALAKLKELQTPKPPDIFIRDGDYDLDHP
jgi:basic membrane lipoprotein Med (substrate-binding protein (PBP1-ABC) superfamily)